MIENEFKDYTILCTTGAKSKEIEAFKVFKNTMTADDILSGKKYPGKNIVIIGGGSVGCETADYLAPLINDMFPANRKVTILEMTNALMPGEGGAAKSVLTRRLMEKGVRIEMNAKVTGVSESEIYFEQEGVTHTIKNADTLVFAVGYTPVPLNIQNATFIGDCEKIGNLQDAITNAYKATINL